MIQAPQRLYDSPQPMRLPAWESESYSASQWGIRLIVRRNPYRDEIEARRSGDAITVRYWDWYFLVVMGRRRFAFWHFTQYHPS